MKYVFFYNWINKLFSEENEVPRTLLEARKVAGSATYKQSETVWRCVCVFSWFGHENVEGLFIIKIRQLKIFLCSPQLLQHMIDAFMIPLNPKYKQIQRSVASPSYVLCFLKRSVHISFLSQRSNFSLRPLPPYAFVFSFVLLKRINILEGISSPAFLSFHHLPSREKTLKASAPLSLEEEPLAVLYRRKPFQHIFLLNPTLLLARHAGVFI